MQLTKLLKGLLLGIGFVLPTVLFAAPADLVAARYHFGGGAQMVADPAMAKLKQISALPATPAFREQVVRKTATVLADSLRKQLNPAATDGAALLQPLLDDLVQFESFGILGGRANMPLGFVLAVRLDDSHAKTWQENLGRLLGGGVETVKLDGFAAQQWRKQAFRVTRAKDWLVVSRGDDLTAQQSEVLRGIAQQNRPGQPLQGECFEADVDWPKMATWLPLENCPFKLARTQIGISTKSDNLKTTVHIQYAEKFQWKSKPWRVPTEIVFDPLVSFSASQDVAPFMKPNPALAQLKIYPWNEQIYTWAMERIPFQTYGAIPVANATNLLRDLSAQIPTIFNPKLKELRSGQIVLQTNHNDLLWQGLPFLTPELKAVKEKSGEYLMAGFFPAPARGKPAPADLFNQFTSRTNLVYYDWELTGPRMQQWRPMVQMLPILPRLGPTHSPHAKPAAPALPAHATNSAAKSKLAGVAREEWLTAVAPLLGNSITEVTVSGPNELTLVRKSPLGFTGLELVLLSHWMTDGDRILVMPNLPVPGMVKP